jgi:hypothetical protein
MKSKEINRKQIINNPPSSVAGFANLGDETPLVNQKNNLDKTKTKYNIEVNITVRWKDNEGKKTTKKKADIPHKCR